MFFLVLVFFTSDKLHLFFLELLFFRLVHFLIFYFIDMLRLANRRSRKPYHLLSTAHRRHLKNQLERTAYNEYECLQQHNLDIPNARADSDFVDKDQFPAECSQTEKDEIFTSDNV